MYILVRNDLDPTYRMVQGMHAVANYMKVSHYSESLRVPVPNWNGTMVCLGVKNEGELMRWIAKLESRGMRTTYFREPDLGNEYTAIVTVAEAFGVFKPLQLADHH